MFAALLANGGPALWPQPASSPSEWIVWGGCMSLAAFLGGWGLLNQNRPSRDTLVGIAMLLALALVGGATLFALNRNHARQMEQNRRDQELREREPTERAAPSH